MKRFLIALLLAHPFAVMAQQKVPEHQFGNTISTLLPSIIPDATGTGPLVFRNGLMLVAPDLGTIASGNRAALTNLNADTVNAGTVPGARLPATPLILEGLSSTQGALGYRGASGSAALSPGIRARLLANGGTGPNPSWTPSAGGIPVEVYGGSADGVTDNLAPVTAAVAALSTASTGTQQDGGCIVFGPGTYYFSAPIDLTGKHGACLHGQGFQGTVFKSTGDYPIVKDDGTFSSPTNRIVIRDIWFQCSGKSNASAHGIQLSSTNTALIERNFFTGCNHGIHTQGVWQVRLGGNRWDGAGAQQNNVCLYMDQPAAADTEHNNTVVAIANICQQPAQYGLRWLTAQGSMFVGNQWMNGTHGVYGCDPGTATFADMTPFECQFVFFNGDQTDTTTGQGWIFRQGVASSMGKGINIINPWAGNSVTAAIDIQGANGLQIVAADVESSDIGINIVNSNNVRIDGYVLDYNRNNNGSAAVALNSTSNSTVSVTTTGSHVIGYNGIVESGYYHGNSIYGDWADCTLGMTFGAGGTTGMTINANSCKYQIAGMTVRMQFYLSWSAIGSSTGAASLTGLPVMSGPAVGWGYGGTSVVFGTGAMAALAGPIVAQVVPAGTTAQLATQGAAGPANLTHANFTNDSVLTGNLQYFKQ